MGIPAYPTADDLKNAIRSLGIIAPDRFGDVVALLNLETRAQAAWEEWEKATDWKPYLAEAADSTRYLPDGLTRYPGAYTYWNGNPLELDYGYVSLTSVRIGRSSTSEGTEVLIDRDFDVLGEDGEQTPWADGKPACAINFYTRMMASEKSIEVIGRRGACAELEASVWLAIQRYGLWLCWQELSLQVSTGLVSIADVAGSHAVFGAPGKPPLTAEADGWLRQFNEATGARARARI